MDDGEGPQRFLGFSLGSDRGQDRAEPLGEPRGQGPDHRHAQQYAMGLPVEWFGQVDVEFFKHLLHPVRWWRHRHDGPGTTGPGRH